MESDNLLIEDGKYTFQSKKRRTLLILIIVIILVIAIGLTLFFVLRSNSDDSNKQDELPFKKVIKEDSCIHLVPKSGKYDYIFIFMHGLFGKGEEYVETFNKKDGPIPENFKIILPTAHSVYVSRLEFNTTSWFDLKGINNDVIKEKDMDFDDMEISGNLIKHLINEEVKNVNNDYSKIFIGGFSQGACMSYHIGLSFEHTLGGLLNFCGIPVTKTQIYENRENLNILTIAGGKDIYFPLDYFENQTYTVLQNFTNLTIIPFPNEEHAVTKVGLDEVKKYIKSWL